MTDYNHESEYDLISYFPTYYNHLKDLGRSQILFGTISSDLFFHQLPGMSLNTQQSL
jgi:hypothetical protein